VLAGSSEIESPGDDGPVLLELTGLHDVLGGRPLAGKSDDVSVNSFRSTPTSGETSRYIQNHTAIKNSNNFNI
jgi:hypothetical protein